MTTAPFLLSAIRHSGVVSFSTHCATLPHAPIGTVWHSPMAQWAEAGRARLCRLRRSMPGMAAAQWNRDVR
jgi:hypothetical protein